MSSLPEVYEVMRRIDSCKSEPNKQYMRAEFLFCARGIEVAGQLTSTDCKRHTIPYGPTGKDVFFTEIDPPDIPANQMLVYILKALTDKSAVDMIVKELSRKIPVAVFKVTIAKQHLEVFNNQKEAYPFRYVALPTEGRYHPWVQPLIERYHDAGEHVVFDFNRQDNWEYITREDKIFDGLFYPIKKYHYYPNGDVTAEPVPCFSHLRFFKCHAIRHVRTDQLIADLKFDGFDLQALVGWSAGSGNKISSAPAQASNYAEIRQAWRRYVHKFCVPFNYQAFSSVDNKESFSPSEIKKQ
ncbi:MAG: hypothetical protein IMZ53_11645 [Thermoplasmata archaeon]|nr:hypothetical protein [Thermoplasmata archaeon]